MRDDTFSGVDCVGAFTFPQVDQLRRQLMLSRSIHKGSGRDLCSPRSGLLGKLPIGCGREKQHFFPFFPSQYFSGRSSGLVPRTSHTPNDLFAFPSFPFKDHRNKDKNHLKNASGKMFWCGTVKKKGPFNGIIP